MVPCTTTTLVKTRYFLSALHLKENIFSKLNKETLTIYFCEAPHIDFMSFARVEGSFILISFSPLDYFITGFVGVCVIIFIYDSIIFSVLNQIDALLNKSVTKLVISS